MSMTVEIEPLGSLEISSIKAAQEVVPTGPVGPQADLSNLVVNSPLTFDGTDTLGLSETDLVPGSSGELLFNDGGVLGTNSSLTYDGSALHLPSISAPEDSLTGLVNAGVTSNLSSGTTVGYSFDVNSQPIAQVQGTADGNGGLSGGKLVVRQPGGTAGTDEVLISHGGARATIESEKNGIDLVPEGGKRFRITNNAFQPRNKQDLGSSNQHFTNAYISGYIGDPNDNELLSFTSNSSAVNHFQVANASSGSAPTLSAVGGDSNVRLRFEYKGNGSFDFVSPGDLSPAFKAINSNGNTVIRFGGTSNNAFIDSFGTSPLVLRTAKNVEAARYTPNQEWLLGKTSHAADLAEVAGTVRAEGGNRSANPTIPDDDFSTVSPDRSRVKVFVSDGQGEVGEAILDISAGTVLHNNYTSANVAFAAGDHTGTTGTDNTLTVAADSTNGTIDVENRLGGSRTVTVSIIG